MTEILRYFRVRCHEEVWVFYRYEQSLFLAIADNQPYQNCGHYAADQQNQKSIHYLVSLVTAF